MICIAWWEWLILAVITGANVALNFYIEKTLKDIKARFIQETRLLDEVREHLDKIKIYSQAKAEVDD